MKQAQNKIIKSEFEQMIEHQATEKEIANYYNISIDSVKRWCQSTYNQTFQETYNIYKNKGFISLRRKAFEMALNGNTTMMIFLCKNYLNMTDQIKATQEEKVIIINDITNSD